jgi:hypothetical protein
MARPPHSSPPSKPRKQAQASVETVSEPSDDLAALPAGARAMRDRMLAAVAAGDIDALRPVIEFNETPPLFARGGRPISFAAAIDFLKARSFDGKGREILALLGAILEQPYARVTRGPVETYVWPAFAARQKPDPSAEERLAMYRCSRFANILLTNDIGLPLIERVGIGADGTWHYFWAG